MKKLLFGAFLVTLVAATPARAQSVYEDRPVHVNIGGGFTMPMSDVSDRFGTGGGFNLGVIFEPSTIFGLQVEYGYNGLSGEETTVPLSATPIASVITDGLIESHHSMHYLTFNGRAGHVLPVGEPDDAGCRLHHVLRSLLVCLLPDLHRNRPRGR
jgi:opacity protein-like surface antigen